MMKSTAPLSPFAAAALAIMTAACVQTAPEPTLIEVSVPLVADQCHVAFAQVTITATDIDRISEQLDVEGDAIQGMVAGVPAGPERLVTVQAFDDHYEVVYAGSALVDVVDGQTATASLLLYRNWDSCPASSGSGDVDVLGDLDNGTAGGPAIQGQFTFTDARLGGDGVLYFLDTAGGRVRRLHLATGTFLPPLNGTLAPVTAFAVSPSGSTVYLSYEGGRIDAFDTSSGTPRLFGVAASTASALAVAGDYLFTIEGPGYSYGGNQALYLLATGERVAFATRRSRGRDVAYSALNRRVYFLGGDYYDERRIVAVPIAAPGDELLGEEQQPYSRDDLPTPLRLSADEQRLVLGNGAQFSASDLTYLNSFGLPFTDVAFSGAFTYVASVQGGPNSRSGQTLIRSLDADRTIVGNRIIPGTPLRVFSSGSQLVVVSEQGMGHLAIRLVDLPL